MPRLLYYVGITPDGIKTDYLCIDTITDKNGCFSANFEKGYKAIVASVTSNYYPALKSFQNVSDKPVEINLKLKRKTGNEAELNLSPDINLRYYIVENTSN
jgi:hypothetical protein